MRRAGAWWRWRRRQAARRAQHKRWEQSSSFVAAALDAAPGIAVVVDPARRVVLANRKAREVCGGRDPAACGMRCHQVSHGSDTPCCGPNEPCPLAMVLAQRRPVSVRHVHRYPNGEERRVIVYAAPLLDRRGRPTHVVECSVDVTDLEMAEKAFRDRDRLLHTITTAARDGLVLMGPRGEVLFWNEAAERIFGYSADEALGQNVHELLAPAEERTRHRRQFPVFQRTGSGSCVGKTVELTAIRKDMRPVAVELSLSAVQQDGQWLALGVVRDVTDRKKREQEFRKLWTAVEQSSLMVVVTDAEGVIEYVNPEFCEVTGYEEAEVLGQTPRLLKSEKTPRRTHTELWSTILAGDVWRGEFCNRKKNGELYWEEAVIAPVIDDRGRITNFIAWKQDITQRKAMERVMQEKEAQLRQAQKMEVIGQLAGGIAHEFNNLLQAIRGFTVFAMEALPAEHEAKADLEQVVTAADRAAELTRQLLDFSRREPMERGLVDVNELLRDTAALLRPALGETIDVNLELEDGLPLVLGDRRLLRQAITNLCLNARDAMPAGGRLTLGSRRLRLEGQEAPPAGMERRQWVRITVRDTGCGMPPDVLERVFEPFFTTKEVGKGAGLGLAMVYGTVEEHGGRIQASSELGRGSQFQIDLPAAEDGQPSSDANADQLAAVLARP